MKPGTKVEVVETVLTLFRADGTAAFETIESMAFDGHFETEKAQWGKLPKGFTWQVRQVTRTGYIGPEGGFIETSRAYNLGTDGIDPADVEKALRVFRPVPRTRRL